MEIIVALLVLGVVSYALLLRSSEKTNEHNASQRSWRQQVVQQLDLGEYVQSNGYTLGLRRDAAELAVVDASGEGYWIPIASIRHIELKETEDANFQETAQTTTNRGSQIGGALIGGALAGPVGVAVGGLTGKRTTVSTGSSQTFVSSIELRLDLRNDAIPTLRLSFSGGEWDPATKSFVGGVSDVQRFADRLRWGVDKQGEAAAHISPSRTFQAIRLAARPADTQGWWSSTFGQ